jgi:hypothetical protein
MHGTHGNLTAFAGHAAQHYGRRCYEAPPQTGVSSLPLCTSGPWRTGALIACVNTDTVSLQVGDILLTTAS